MLSPTAGVARQMGARRKEQNTGKNQDIPIATAAAAVSSTIGVAATRAAVATATAAVSSAAVGHVGVVVVFVGVDGIWNWVVIARRQIKGEACRWGKIAVTGRT